MNEFLKLNPTDKFWQLLEDNIEIEPPGVETVNFDKVLNRVVARDILSPEDLPPFSRSTVDGYAVRAADTAGANEARPVYLEVAGEVKMGEKTELQLQPGEVIEIPTGGMLPAGADAVVMVEYTDRLSASMVEITSAVAGGDNVVRRGEDIEQGEFLFAAGHVMRSPDIGALAGLGITEIEVYKKPRIAIISTGDELVTPDTEITPGQIRDINSYTIGAMLKEINCLPRYVGIIEDSFSQLKKAIEDNLDAELVLVSGGSSVGVKDMTIDILNSLDNPGVLLHGLSLKPGKPTILAVVSETPVVGLPGHPASSWNIANRIIKPLARRLRGEKSEKRPHKILKACLTRNLESDKGREEYIPVRLQKGQEGEYLARPITGKSSLITTLARANGYIRIDTYSEGIAEGTEVEVEFY